MIFEVEGNTVFVLAGTGHNLFSFAIQPGCHCEKCRLEATRVDYEDTSQIATYMAKVLNNSKQFKFLDNPDQESKT